MLLRASRSFSISARVRASKFEPLPEYPLKCGLELHTQLKTKHKLFSLTPSSEINTSPNTKVSYFDSGLPGTQPKLNPEALYFALRAAVALDCEVQPISKFDRKHYFYPDQPLGYQITQFYKPIAKNGQLVLKEPLDDVGEMKNKEGSKTIRIQQIQIEQDTGRSIYRKDGSISVDLNRANTPLIELVTLPDFENIQQVRSFVKKYQQLVKYLDICTGELETGAIRVDVNVSVDGGQRIEIKNLRNTKDIVDAIEYEYFRQVNLIKEGTPIAAQETRGWDGSKTISQRSKEDAVDYRYFPDSELPYVELSPSIESEIRSELPKLPHDLAQELIEPPFNLELKHARFLIDNKSLLEYYLDLHHILVKAEGLDGKYAGNWVFNNLLSTFKKLKSEVNVDNLPVREFARLIKGVVSGSISKNSGKSILVDVIQKGNDMRALIDEAESAANDYKSKGPDNSASNAIDVNALCGDVIRENPDTVSKINSGKAKSINYLIGMAMKKAKGKVPSKALEQKFMELLNIKNI